MNQSVCIAERYHQFNTFYYAIDVRYGGTFRGHTVSRNRRCRAACYVLRSVLFPQESPPPLPSTSVYSYFLICCKRKNS